MDRYLECICATHGEISEQHVHIANGRRICMMGDDCGLRLRSQAAIDAEAMMNEVIQEVYDAT